MSPSNKLPAPPRPDPVTLDQIYDTLTSNTTSMEDKAYQLVALNTVAFHPSVKLYMFDHFKSTLSRAATGDSNDPNNSMHSVNERNRLFREKLLKSIAFFLAQRNSAVCKECRWETVSLLGELCRMENTHGTRLNGVMTTTTNNSAAESNNTQTNDKVTCQEEETSKKSSVEQKDHDKMTKHRINKLQGAKMANEVSHLPSSPKAELEYKLNMYAKSNLEFLASLPWFVPAVEAIIGVDTLTSTESANKTNSSNATITTSTSTSTSTSDHGATNNEGDGDNKDITISSTSSNRAVLQKRLRAQRSKLQSHEQEQQHCAKDSANSNKDGIDNDVKESDEDVVIALKDILHALPTKVSHDHEGHTSYTFEWSESNLAQAYDLMFIDASTSMLHYIPPVSRNSSTHCAYCNKESTTPIGTKGTDENVKLSSLLRCASCKSVYYCGAPCQAAHWRAAHKIPCIAYKKRCEEINSSYEQLNNSNSDKKGNRKAKRVTSQKSKSDLELNAMDSTYGKDKEDDGGVTILEVPLEPTLFYETRRYLYDHRDSYFANVSFYDYFMKYTTHGN